MRNALLASYVVPPVRGFSGGCVPPAAIERAAAPVATSGGGVFARVSTGVASHDAPGAR